MFNNFWAANALKSVGKQRFSAFRRYRICLSWIFRGSVAYVITSSHFDNIDSSEETNAFRPFEPNRSDCWYLCRVHTAQFSKSSDHCSFHTARLSGVAFSRCCFNITRWIGDRRIHTAWLYESPTTLSAPQTTAKRTREVKKITQDHADIIVYKSRTGVSGAPKMF